MVTTLPVFLVGVMAPALKAELGYSESDLGFLVSIYFGLTALGAIPIGRWVDGVGSRVGARCSIVFTTVALAAASIGFQYWAIAVSVFVFAAAGNLLSGPSSAKILLTHVTPSHLGFAYGIRQSAAPLAVIVAGLLVPAMLKVSGWRLTFVAVGGLALVAMMLIFSVLKGSGREASSRESKERLSGLRYLLAATVGFGISIATVTSLTTFYPSFAVQRGWSLTLAASSLGVGSGVAVMARLYLGWFTDRRLQHLSILAGAPMAAGGMLLLGLSHSVIELAASALIVGSIALGWGWPGIAAMAISRAYRGSVGLALGVFVTGGAVGGALGPGLAGRAIVTRGYADVWFGLGLLMALGAIILTVAMVAMLKMFRAA